MTWVAAGVGIGSTVLGFLGSKKADKQADRDRARSVELESRQLQLAQNQDRRAGQLFEHYTRNFQPREQQFVEEAFKPITADAEEAAAVADVRGSLATARRSDEQRQRATGVNPASGAAASMGAARSLEEARIEGAARTRARGAVRDLNFNRQGAALGLANPGAAAPFASGAQAGLGQVSSLAASRSRLSDDYAYEAGGNFGAAAGELAGTGLGMLRDRRQNRSAGVKPTMTGVDVPAPGSVLTRNQDLMVA
jgi:hypothetical protein